MDLTESSRNSILPINLYTNTSMKWISGRRFISPSPSKPGKAKIEMYSLAFYAACTAAVFSAVVLLIWPSLLSTLSSIDLAKYKSISFGFRVLLKEQGLKGFFRGWVLTLLGYSAQGACKFGFYEFFKKYYSDLAGPEYATNYRTFIYLVGSTSVEVIADVALCPFKAVNVRVQTQPGFARGMADGFPMSRSSRVSSPVRPLLVSPAV